MNNQKAKMLWNCTVLFFAGGFITGTYMYAAAEKVHDRQKCPICIEENNQECSQSCEQEESCSCNPKEV